MLILRSPDELSAIRVLMPGREAENRPDDAAGPLGAVLAGGLGRRLGGSKATVALAGRPLISYPLQALRCGLGAVVVVAKGDTQLPRGLEAPVWVEPERPRHPLTGLVHALSLAGGRPVLVCACDLPLVTEALVRELALADPGQSPAVVARAEGRLQPLLGCYRPTALPLLSEALRQEGVPLVQVVSELGVRPFDIEDPNLLLNVNTPEDLLQAAALLPAAASRRSRTSTGPAG